MALEQRLGRDIFKVVVLRLIRSQVEKQGKQIMNKVLII